MTTIESTDTAVLARLAELGAATVYEANGQIGAFDAGIKPLDPTSPAGRPGRHPGPGPRRQLVHPHRAARMPAR